MSRSLALPLYFQIFIILNLSENIEVDENPKKAEDDAHASYHKAVQLEAPVTGRKRGTSYLERRLVKMMGK